MLMMPSNTLLKLWVKLVFCCLLPISEGMFCHIIQLHYFIQVSCQHQHKRVKEISVSCPRPMDCVHFCEAHSAKPDNVVTKQIHALCNFGEHNKHLNHFVRMMEKRQGWIQSVKTTSQPQYWKINYKYLGYWMLHLQE